MARILIAWELGAGFGHITRLLAIAGALKARGHRPFLALSNLVETWPAYRSTSYPILQSPMYQRPPGPRRRLRTASLTDILALCGFLNADELLAMVRAWERLIDAVRPGAIVADYSPTLSLAAFGAHPLVAIGDGFTLPPHDLPTFPALQPRIHGLEREERMLEVVRRVQRARRRPQPEAMPQIFAARAQFVCTLPELDPYRAWRDRPAEGAFEPLPKPAPPAAGPGFFAYLAADARFIATAVRGLAEAPVKGRFFIRRAPGNMKRLLAERGHHVYDRPAPIQAVLREVPAIVHHGGIGTTEIALALGRPQLLFPRHLEQQLTATALVKLGVGISLGGKFTQAQVIEALRRLLEDRRFARRAQAFAARLAKRKQRDNVARIADACAEIAMDGALPH